MPTLFSQRVIFFLGIGCIVLGGVVAAFSFWEVPARIAYLYSSEPTNSSTSTLLSFEIVTSTASEIIFATSSVQYRLIIPKIGVDMPIIINEKSETRGLARGAWQIPGTALPGETGGYGNMVLSAHRYLYTSGPRTFFNLDKLETGDEIFIQWLGKTYTYAVDGSKVVRPTAVEILNPTAAPRLTLFTCTPVFTTKNRLVITAVPK